MQAQTKKNRSGRSKRVSYRKKRKRGKGGRETRGEPFRAQRSQEKSQNQRKLTTEGIL